MSSSLKDLQDKRKLFLDGMEEPILDSKLNKNKNNNMKHLMLKRTVAMILAIFMIGIFNHNLWAFDKYFNRYWKSIYVSESSVHGRDYIIFDHKNSEFVHSISSHGIKKDLYIVGHWTIKNDTIVCTPKFDFSLLSRGFSLDAYPQEDVATGNIIYARSKFIAKNDTLFNVTDTAFVTTMTPSYKKYHLVHGEPF